MKSKSEYWVYGLDFENKVYFNNYLMNVNNMEDAKDIINNAESIIKSINLFHCNFLDFDNNITFPDCLKIENMIQSSDQNDISKTIARNYYIKYLSQIYFISDVGKMRYINKFYPHTYEMINNIDDGKISEFKENVKENAKMKKIVDNFYYLVNYLLSGKLLLIEVPRDKTTFNVFGMEEKLYNSEIDECLNNYHLNNYLINMNTEPVKFFI